MRDEARAQRAIDFIEKLKITIGDDAGKPFRLREWQKAFIRDVLAPKDERGLRKVRRAILSIARKNGKTELAAALILVFLIGPEAELNGEIYSAANDRAQASIVFNAVVRMINASPYLKRNLGVTASRKTIFVRKSNLRSAGSKFVALAADGDRVHGLNPSFVVYDELAQSKNRNLLSALTTSQGARKEPLFLTISTQNNDPTHPLSEMIDDGLNSEDETVCCHLYAADDDCDVLDEEQWAKANPALGDFRSLDELRVMAHRADRLPSEEAEFRLLYLNQRVSLHSPLIAAKDWKDCYEEFELEPGSDIYLGLDMSKTTDLTALLAVSAGDMSRTTGWYWKPEDYLQEHAKRDRVQYDVYAKQGSLLTSPGRDINPRLIARKVIELFDRYNVLGMAFDYNMMKEVLRYFDDEGFHASEDGKEGGLRLVKWGQGFSAMNPAVNAFEKAILLGELRHDGHPLTTRCVTNAVAITNDAGYRKLDKSKATMRIDGAVALAMALGLKAIDRLDQREAVSPWEDPDFTMF